MSKAAPYGSWLSAISAEMIVSQTVGLSQIILDGEDCYYLESRPSEKGRSVIVKYGDAGPIEILPTPFNARTTAHEYGGSCYTVYNGVVYFCEKSDQQIYTLFLNSETPPEYTARALTVNNNVRYADLTIDTFRQRLICVSEDYSDESQEPVASIIAINLKSGISETNPLVLISGDDFYSNPQISPDGNQLSWLSWSHPNMPWDETKLWLANLTADGAVEDIKLIAGGNQESLFQPQWSPDGLLYFVSDRNNWWNLYQRSRDGTIRQITHREAEFGLPQWVFGMSTYGFLSAGQIFCTYSEMGIWRLATIDIAADIDALSSSLSTIESDFTYIEGVRASNGTGFFFGTTPTSLSALIKFTAAAQTFQTLAISGTLAPDNSALDNSHFSIAEPIEFPSGNSRNVYAFFYQPKNPRYHNDSSERPPLIVLAHGGPTGATSSALNVKNQYWTSRGFAVLDVNYSGSTGFGKTYRNRLLGNWGLLDVEDCVKGAEFLVARGDVDDQRLFIKGGSAGGYTVLAALTFFNTFKAGASHYGIGDLETLAKDTHKFESRYCDSLVGPYPASIELYRQRSPIYHVDQLSCPIIFFQGLEDKVVPPNQAELMVQALENKGLPVAYVAFEGEGHGFRQAANIKRSLEAELYFYAKLFNFPLAESIDPVEIKNLN